MRRKRTAIAIVAAVGLVVGVAFITGPAVAERILHPRDEGAFTGYVATYFPGWASSASPGVPARDLEWVKQHPDAVLAEGDAACAWLESQPDVPGLVPSGSATVGAMIGRYQRETADSTETDIDERSRSSIVAGAWGYLCHGAREAKTSPASTYDD